MISEPLRSSTHRISTSPRHSDTVEVRKHHARSPHHHDIVSSSHVVSSGHTHGHLAGSTTYTTGLAH